MLVLVGLLLTASLGVLFYFLLTIAVRAFRQQQQRVEDAARLSLTELFIFVEPRRLFQANVALLILVPTVAYAITTSVAMTVVAAIAAALFPRQWVKWLRQRRLAQFVTQLPDALLMLSSSLKAGAGVASAMEVVAAEQPAPLSQEIALLLREQRMGVSFETALEHLEARLPVEEFRLFAAALRISREVGGNLAETLETLAGTLMRKAEVEGKIRSLTAQGKMQGLVMTALPVVLMLVLRVLEPAPMRLLFHSVGGWLVLFVIAVMEILGYVFIQRIVAIEI